MNRNTKRLQRRRIVIGMALTVGLVGCGGGGGDSTEPPSQTALVAITAANQDTVSHAAATALGMIGVTTAMPLSAAPGVSRRLDASGAGAPANRPLSVYGPEVQACAVSGSMSLLLDDRNGNGAVDVGDILAMDFNACANDASGTANGHMEATITAMSEWSMGLRVAMTAMKTTYANHELTADGTMAVDITADAAGNTATMRLTTEGALTVAARTHGFDDTVTLQSGFVQNASFGIDGASFLTAQGRIASTAMGGAVDVSTLDALVTTSPGASPSAGAIRLTGKVGKLTLTAAGEAARMDLDDDDDNETEATRTSTWDWLL